MKVLLITKNEKFIDNLEKALLLEERDFEIECALNKNGAEQILKEAGFNSIANSERDREKLKERLKKELFDRVVVDKENFNTGKVLSQFFEVVSIAFNKAELLSLEDKNIYSYGLIGNTNHFLDCLDKNKKIKFVKEEKQQEDVLKDLFSSSNELFNEDEESSKLTPANNNHTKPSKTKTRDLYEDDFDDDFDDFDDDYNDSSPRRKPKEHINASANKKDLRKKIKQSSKKTNRHLDKEIERDMRARKKRAKVITVYSAKGGVGKTSLSCELSSFISLLANGRSTYQVCVVDFDIDYGDVLTTLNLDEEGPNMSEWAEEIMDRIENGEKPEEIIYPTKVIRSYMQKDGRTGLYALTAPLTVEESSRVSDVVLQVMIENITKNGDFDFIVFDTGNNTRDSSLRAIEAADDVLLVLTQDTNTINCNDTFLSTLESLQFDMSKIHTVLNQVQSRKETGIDTDDVERCLETEDGLPYDCIGRIKMSRDVRISKNDGEPLILDKNNDFTKSIADIAQSLVGTRQVLTSVTKKGKSRRKR